MLNYKAVVVAENRHKVYGCELTNGEFMRLEVVEGIKMGTWFLQDYDDVESSTYYLESDIVEIYNELADLEDEYEHGIKIDYETLKPFTTPSTNVYKYDQLDELDIIIKALDEPIVNGLGCSWKEDYKKGLTKSYGLLFFWSEYDNLACGNPYTPYCKIIDGGCIGG